MTVTRHCIQATAEILKEIYHVHLTRRTHKSRYGSEHCSRLLSVEDGEIYADASLDVMISCYRLEGDVVLPEVGQEPGLVRRIFIGESRLTDVHSSKTPIGRRNLVYLAGLTS